jgi:WD40 repeat protein
MRISTLFLRHLAVTVFAAGFGWPAPRAELVAQTGHTNAIDAVAFSRDGSLLASGGHDAIIKLWDVRSGSELRALAGHTNTITALVFSNDGKTVVSGALDSTVRFWDVASGNVIRTIHRSVGVTSLALSFDGQTLAISGFDPEVRLVDFKTGNQIQVLKGHTKVVNSASFSSNGLFLATGSNDNSVRVWDVPSGREVRMMAFPSSSAPTATVRDARTGQEIEKPQNFNTDCVTSVVFSPDNSTLASVSYNLKNYGVNGVSFAIGLWDIASGKKVREVDSFMGGGPANFIFLPEHNSVAGSVSFSPDGQTLLATGSDYSIKQWDVRTGNLIKVLPVIRMEGDAQKAYETLAKFQAIRWDPPRLPTFSPNGKTAAIVLENSVLIWDVPAARLVNDFAPHAASVPVHVANPLSINTECRAPPHTLACPVVLQPVCGFVGVFRQRLGHRPVSR